MIGRIASWTLMVGAMVGCGSWSRVGSEDQPETSATLTQLLDAPQFYREIGRLAAGEPLPFVGTVAFAAGAADSVITVVGLSLENRALTFQKEGNGFVGRYVVDLAFQRSGEPPITVSRNETVRVPTFEETQRSDESVLFQQVFKLLPGTYGVTVTVRDPVSSAQTTAEREYTAPDFDAASTSAPILAYQVAGRGAQGEPLQVVLNSRGTVAYGGDTLLAYIEGYDFPGPATVPFEVRTERDSVVYRDSLRFRGGASVEGQVLRLRPDSMALGELKLVVGSGDSARSVSALVSFSAAWVVTNFDEMVSLLRYFGHEPELDALRDATPGERAELWRDFYAATDPNPITPENEAIDQYFARLAVANQRFTQEGVPGWRTDRGEVFITLGEPDETFDFSPTTQGRFIRWNYISNRLSLVFHDPSGFGRFNLTPSSRADYERVLNRERRQAE